MAKWIDIDLEKLLPKALESLIDKVAGLATQVAEALKVLGTIVSIIGAFIQGVTALLASAIQLLLDAINDFLEDLLSTGVYVCAHVPTSLALAREPDIWLEDIAASFDDLSDNERPLFSEDAYVGGLVIMAGAPNFQDLWALLGKLLALFNFDFEYAPTDMTPEENLAKGGTGRQPDWESTNLGELIPPLRDVIHTLQEGLGMLSVLPEAANAVSQFGDWLKKKGEKLENLATDLENLIMNLIEAIKQTGLYGLPIAGKGGSTLLQGELRWSVLHKDDTNFPTFGDADVSGSAQAIAGGVMIVTGGPSEAPVSALFNLFGIDYSMTDRDPRFFSEDPDLAEQVLKEELEAMKGLEAVFGEDTSAFTDAKAEMEAQLKEKARKKADKLKEQEDARLAREDAINDIGEKITSPGDIW